MFRSAGSSPAPPLRCHRCSRPSSDDARQSHRGRHPPVISARHRRVHRKRHGRQPRCVAGTIRNPHRASRTRSGPRPAGSFPEGFRTPAHVHAARDVKGPASGTLNNCDLTHLLAWCAAQSCVIPIAAIERPEIYDAVGDAGCVRSQGRRVRRRSQVHVSLYATAPKNVRAPSSLPETLTGRSLLAALASLKRDNSFRCDSSCRVRRLPHRRSQVQPCRRRGRRKSASRVALAEEARPYSPWSPPSRAG